MNHPNLSSSAYREKCERAVHALESIRRQERGKLWGRVRIIAGVALALATFLALRLSTVKQAISGGDEGYVQDPNEVFTMVAIGVVVFGAIAGSVLLWVFSRRGFEKRAKIRVLQPLMMEVFPDMVYEPHGKVGQAVFDASGLFTRDYNFYEGEDYFQGSSGSVWLSSPISPSVTAAPTMKIPVRSEEVLWATTGFQACSCG
jgi:hypothetical protein